MTDDDTPKSGVTFKWLWKFPPPAPPSFLPRPVKLVCRVRGPMTVTFFSAMLVDDYLIAYSHGTSAQVENIREFDFGWACESAYVPLFAQPLEYEPPLPS